MKWIWMMLVLATGCAPALYVPTVDNIPAGADLKALREGRGLYVDKCGRCHMLHLPNEYSAESWAEHLEVMQKKAKISDAERALIFGFLTQATAGK